MNINIVTCTSEQMNDIDSIFSRHTVSRPIHEELALDKEFVYPGNIIKAVKRLGASSVNFMRVEVAYHPLEYKQLAAYILDVSQYADVWVYTVDAVFFNAFRAVLAETNLIATPQVTANLIVLDDNGGETVAYLSANGLFYLDPHIQHKTMFVSDQGFIFDLLSVQKRLREMVKT